MTPPDRFHRGIWQRGLGLTAATYLPTPQGQRVAIFCTKVHNRLLRPLLAANDPPAPTELRHALTTIDRHVHAYIDNARMGTAA